MGRVEDQGEWERCKSTRRMFLALQNSGRRDDLTRIAEGLLAMALKRLPNHPKVIEASDFYANGMRDEKGKEQADRTYIVIRLVAEAVDKLQNAAWAGGGEVLICTAIRRVTPQAPQGFARVGKLEGGPHQPGLSAQTIPHRSLIDLIQQGGPH